MPTEKSLSGSVVTAVSQLWMSVCRLCHKLDHSLILSVEQKNLGGNTDRLAPIQKSPIPEFSMFGSRDEMSASGKVVVNGGLD